jgi:hypothetical protein
MDGVRRLPLPLLVAGTAMVVAALHGGSHSRSVAAAVAGPASYVPPATSTATVQPASNVRVRPRTRPHQGRTATRAPLRTPAVARHHAPAAQKPTAHTAAAPAAAAPVQPVHTVAVSLATSVSGPTGWSALNAAIARIPTYRSGAARWVVSNKYDFWGTADWYHDVLYVAPGVPVAKLYDVAVHEWSHELSVLDYAGDVAGATRAMNRAFGGHGLTGAERAADCMAILQGARWTHYTTCTNGAWRAAAAKLVAGHRL